MKNKFHHKIHKAWTILVLAGKKFSHIDGVEWAGAFAFNAFFSLFPLVILLVSIVSSFIERDTAVNTIIGYIKNYVPITGEMKRYVFDTIDGVIKERNQAGVIASFFLIWVTIQCFTTLIIAAVNAWGVKAYSWWRIVVKSLLFFGISVLAISIGIAIPALIKILNEWLFPSYEFRSWVIDVGKYLFPMVIIFFGLSQFYRLAPNRETKFSEIWIAALLVTVLIRGAISLFGVYLSNFSTLNAVYGAFGGIMALLLWIYLSGCFFIFGACLSAVQAEQKGNAAHKT
ncbi:MAG: YihY/virulence factor BrkB family protein [Bacteroidota bacterium]